jgi:imidazolonepropionase-like amidohydrolase
MLKRVSLAVSFAVAVCVAPEAAQNTPPPRPIALEAAHLFDGVSGRLTDNGVIVVSDGRIQRVGGPVPPGAEVIDLGDATLLPGFIDSHVHMDSEGQDNWYLGFYQGLMEFPAEQALRATVYAKKTLEAGFTTVRDLGSSDYVALGLRNAIQAGAIEGPRMLIANYAIGSTRATRTRRRSRRSGSRRPVRCRACATAPTSVVPRSAIKSSTAQT